MIETPEVTLKLRVAAEDDFNYVDQNGNTNLRIGFAFFMKEKAGFTRYVFDHRITASPERRKALKRQISTGKIFVIKATHPRNNLPGIKIGF